MDGARLVWGYPSPDNGEWRILVEDYWMLESLDTDDLPIFVAGSAMQA